MAVLPILLFGEPLLRQKAKRVSSFDSSLQRLIDDMVETMRYASGVGLAAPQVGVSLRVIVVEVPSSRDFGELSRATQAEGLGEEPLALVNPQVVKRRGEQLVEEGCLSLPGYLGEVKRSAFVTVKGLDRRGKEIRIKGEGLLAQALEHEIDHLNGILYTDYLESMDKLYKIEPEEEAREI